MIERWRPWREHTVTIDATVAGSIDDCVQPVHEPSLDEAFRDAFVPRLFFDPSGDDRKPVCGLWLTGSGAQMGKLNAVLADQPDLTLAAVVRLMADDVEVATGRFWLRLTPSNVPHHLSWISLDPTQPGFSESSLEGRRLSIEIKGDAMTALRDYQCERYWAGSIRLPLSEERGSLYHW
jgi:hypothetical protein